MKAEGLLRRQPAPSRDEIARALAGNLCRCTGYVKVVDAIERVAAVRRGAARPAAGASADARLGAPGGGVGARADRIGARAMALGEQPFVADMTAPGMLHGALRLSDHPRAVVRRIDTSRAAAAPGRRGGRHRRRRPRRARPGAHRPRLAGLRRRGRDDALRRRRAGRGRRADAPRGPRGRGPRRGRVRGPRARHRPVRRPRAGRAGRPRRRQPPRDVGRPPRRRRGGPRGRAHVVRERFTTSAIEHAFLEPEACLAVPRDSAAAAPTPRRSTSSRRARAPGRTGARSRRSSACRRRDVRVTQVATGGAFGGKEDLSVQGQAALLAPRRPAGPCCSPSRARRASASTRSATR